MLGYRDFRSLRLGVNRHVLIPRRETEHLVEWAIECIDAGARRVLDLGTGSGAIALACKSERPDAMLTAIDCSTEALTCAKANARSLGVQVEWLRVTGLSNSVSRGGIWWFPTPISAHRMRTFSRAICPLSPTMH